MTTDFQVFNLDFQDAKHTLDKDLEILSDMDPNHHKWMQLISRTACCSQGVPDPGEDHDFFYGNHELKTYGDNWGSTMT